MTLFNPYLMLLACLFTTRALAQLPDDEPSAVAQVGPQPAPINSSPQALMAFQELTDDRTSFTRTITKSLPVDAKTTLSIDNRFGDVTVSLWDRNEFRVTIVIVSSAKEADRAKQALNAVQIDERRTGNTYAFKTMIDPAFEKEQPADKNGETINTRSDERTYPNGLKMSWNSSLTKSNTTLQITYRISMPKANGLTINNSFGNTIIPDFWAPLSVRSKFGDVTGAALNSANTTINASFGNVSIRDVQNGNVVMSFGDLDINSGNVLSIEQKYGKLNIGETNKVDMRTSYTDALIGLVNQSGKFRMNYARQFRVGRIGASADKIDVEASYTTVALPMQSMPNCSFNVTVTHGGFTYPTLLNLQLLAQPGPPPPPPHTPLGLSVTAPTPPRPARVRQYVGKVGNGEGPSIKVVTTYGDVRFNK